MNPAGSGSDYGSSLDRIDSYDDLKAHLACASKDGSGLFASNLAKGGDDVFKTHSVLCRYCGCNKRLEHNQDTRYCYTCEVFCGEVGW